MEVALLDFVLFLCGGTFNCFRYSARDSLNLLFRTARCNQGNDRGTWASIRGKLSERVPRIVLGGGAYRLAAQFANELGTLETVTDLRSALALLCA
jgi:hypothetical protein